MCEGSCVESKMYPESCGLQVIKEWETLCATACAQILCAEKQSWSVEPCYLQITLFG